MDTKIIINLILALSFGIAIALFITPIFVYLKKIMYHKTQNKNGSPIYFAVIENPDEEKSINLEDMADKIIKSYRINDGDCYDD